MEQNIVWKWRGIRWLIAFVLFWLIAGGGAGFLARSSLDGQAASGPFVTFVVFIFLVWCAVKDRGNKTIIQKIGWVIGLWIGHSLLSVIVVFTLAGAGVGGADNLQRMSNMIAGYVILYFAMRRSTVFIEKLN